LHLVQFFFESSPKAARKTDIACSAQPAYNPASPKSWIGAFAVRARCLLLLAALLVSTTGCADCLLHTLVGMFPDAYSGGGTSVSEKEADLDRRLLEYQDYETAHKSIVDD
jgi:hypothetical protein